MADNQPTQSELFDVAELPGRPMLHWHGKRPLREIPYYPAQLRERYGPLPTPPAPSPPSQDWERGEGVPPQAAGVRGEGWVNRLYWGDNLQVMAHLMREFRGKIKLIYIDPPFDSGADYRKRIKLRGTSVQTDLNVLDYVNRENALLHDVIVPRIQAALFEYEEKSGSAQEEIELARNFPIDRLISEDQEGLVMELDGGRERSYHLDHYIFDSGEERKLFEMLLTHEWVEEIYFTGGITDPAHNEFYVEYYDELAGQWRKYFPDFFLRLAGDGWMVIEVKRQDQIEHPNVKAKDAAARRVFETLNGILYHIKPDDEIRRGEIHDIFRSTAPLPPASGCLV